MVEQHAAVTPAPPERPSGPSRGRILARRTIALVLLAALLAVIGLVGFAIAAAIRDTNKPKPKPAPIVAPPTLKIIFPEGFTRAEMAERIKAVNQIARQKRKINPKLSPEAYLAASASSRIPGRFAGDHKRRSLEGFLFPSTYDFIQKTTSRQLVNRQLQAFEQNWRQVDLSYAKPKNLTPYDVLIIASMIEKEVIAPEERRLVAAVIYNRLHDGMPLQIDATTRYGFNVPATQPLLESQLNSLNPYNTRRVPGLPPTPIANPGLASMQAAANPAKVDYLFFVRKPDKIHHFFTASQREFDNYKNAHGFG